MTDVWVTGLGAVTPFGWTVAEAWDGVVGGRSGISELDRFETFGAATKIAGTVPGVDDDQVSRSLARLFAESAVAAAIADAGLPSGATDVAIVANHGERRAPTATDDGRIVGVARLAELVAEACGATTSLAPYGACAGGLLAIGAGAKLIEQGRADVVVAGGADCLVRDFDFFHFCHLYAMSTREVAPAEASAPFDSRRDGFVLSEGAGFVVLESEAHARARGARPHATVKGYGYSQNAYHMVASPPDARGPSLAMRRALADAELAPDNVGYVNAHGTSTRDNDWCETLAIRLAFGAAADDLLVSSSKSELGHLMSAAGAVEVIMTIRSLQEGVAPPTINLEEPDPRCDLDYVPNQAREWSPQYALTNSFGFGGHNASMVLARV